MSTERALSKNLVERSEEESDEEDEGSGHANMNEQISDVMVPNCTNTIDGSDEHASQRESYGLSQEPPGILNQLCEPCNAVFQRARSMFQSGVREAHGRFNRAPWWMVNGTITSCHLCALLRYNKAYDLDRFVDDLGTLSERQKQVSYTLEINSESEDAIMLKDIELSLSNEVYPFLSKAHIIFHEDGKPFHVAPFTSSMTWSKHTVDLVVNWLKTCSNYHRDCQSSKTAPGELARRLPLRLLDVGAADENTTSFETIEATPFEMTACIQLRESKSLPEDTQYLTLSHRWGNPQRLILTRATLQAFRQSVPLMDMPLSEGVTFKHAVQVTRCLGFRYLWIDALCIIQDDPEEKMCEIANMGSIYSNSRLNLSAVASSNPSDGLFFQRNLPCVSPCQQSVEFCQNGDQIHGELVAYTCRWLEQVDMAPLHSRGWVFQERILSPRTLYFARDQVFWECDSLLAAESFPFGNSDLRSIYGNRLRLPAPGRPSSESSSLKTSRENWGMLVAAYCYTSLTFPEDRLVAFSAVARRVCELRGLKNEDYIAGLWRPALVEQLLWMVVAPWTSSTGPVTYRAPSWSWASVSAEGILFDLQERGDFVVEVENVCIYLATDDPFGAVAGGVLSLRGPLCKLLRRPPPTGNIMMLSTNDGRNYPRDTITTNWDTVPEEFLEDSGFAQQQSITPESIYLMPFRVSGKGHVKSGLILEPIYGLKGYYRRIGHFHVPEKSPGWDAEFQGVFSPQSLSSVEYQEFDGVDRYTIALI